MNKDKTLSLNLTLLPLGIALNLAIGFIVSTLKLPFFLDGIGTIMITILLGLRSGLIVGVGSFLIGGVLTNPVLPYFIITQASIAFYVNYFATKGMLNKPIRMIFIGIGLGIIAGIVSAPVIVYLFGGITGSGRSLITAYLLSSGKTIFQSVITSGLASEPLDKTIQLFISIWLLRSMPKSILNNFKGGSLKENGFI